LHRVEKPVLSLMLVVTHSFDLEKFSFVYFLHKNTRFLRRRNQRKNESRAEKKTKSSLIFSPKTSSERALKQKRQVFFHAFVRRRLNHLVVVKVVRLKVLLSKRKQ